MPGIVKRVLSFERLEDIFSFGDKIINFSKNTDLKLLASNMSEGLRANVASVAQVSYKKKIKKDDDGKDIINNGIPEYIVDANGNPVDELDSEGRQIPEIDSNGRVSQVVPSIIEHTINVDDINAYWLLLKEYVKDKMTSATDIARARHVCFLLGMRKRWDSLTVDTIVDVSKEEALDGASPAEVSVPLD